MVSIIKENNMEIYYQYEENEQGVIVAIHSSHQPFGEREIPKELVGKVRCGRTTVVEFENLEKEEGQND
jgi:hypothetical protein